MKPLKPRTPVLNAYAERWIKSVQEECLDHFVVFGKRHLDYLIREYVEHYHSSGLTKGSGMSGLCRLEPRFVWLAMVRHRLLRSAAGRGLVACFAATRLLQHDLSCDRVFGQRTRRSTRVNHLAALQSETSHLYRQFITSSRRCP